MESTDDQNIQGGGPGLPQLERSLSELVPHSRSSKQGGAIDNDLEIRMDSLNNVVHGINHSLRNIMSLIEQQGAQQQTQSHNKRKRAIRSVTHMLLPIHEKSLRPSSKVSLLLPQEKNPNEDHGRYEHELYELIQDPHKDPLQHQPEIKNDVEQRSPHIENPNEATEQKEVQVGTETLHQQQEVVPVVENQAIDSAKTENTESLQQPSASSKDQVLRAAVISNYSKLASLRDSQPAVNVSQISPSKPTATETTPSSPSSPLAIDLSIKDQYIRRFSIGQVVRDIQSTQAAQHAVAAAAASDFKKKNAWGRKFFHPSASAVTPLEVLLIHDEKKIHPYSIRHDSKARGRWDVFVLAWVIFDIVLTPLTLSFEDAESSFTRIMNAIGMFVFFLDFLIQMFSSYETERGILMSGPEVTIRHYFTGPWAIPDFLSWFPLELIIARTKFLGAAKVLRLIKASQLARRVHSSKKAGIFRFMRLIGIVFLISHLGTCFWHWIASEWQANTEDWPFLNLSRKYSRCWSLVIGCLNASPPVTYNAAEEITVACLMLIGNFIQASVFGSVAVLISSFDEEETEYNKKIITTYERCKFLGIPEKLTQRIQEYYEHLYKETRSTHTDADSFINELSPALISEVKFQLYREMLEQIPFFSTQKLDSSILEFLILHFRTVIYMKNDVVIRKGEHGDWMGFIGSKGNVGVMDPNSKTTRIIRVLRKGDYFGEMALLERCKRSTTAVALTWVQIHVLSRNDLEDVKDHYPDQAEILESEIIKYMKSKVVYK